MKHFCLSFLCLFLAAYTASAQTTFQLDAGNDTVYVNACTAYTSHNNIRNLTTGDIKLQWRVIENTYPTDWFSTLGICDNKLCYSSADIYVGVQQESFAYTLTPTPVGDFHILGDLAGTATVGPYVVRIRMNNKDMPTDTAIATFIVGKCFSPAGVESVNAATTVNVQLYPNPANALLNVTYNAAAAVKNIAVYNTVGAQISIQSADATAVNVAQLPAGMYLVRLLSATGDVLATRKFTKQ